MNRFYLIFLIAVLTCCGSTSTMESTKTPQIFSETSLETGWYVINDNEEGIKVQLDKDSSYYFLEAEPIVTINRIYSTMIADCDPQNDLTDLINVFTTDSYSKGKSNSTPVLFCWYMQFDSIGSASWKTATEKHLNKQLGFILNGKLIQVSNVTSVIPNGTAIVDRDVYTKKDFEKFDRLINDEKK